MRTSGVRYAIGPYPGMPERTAESRRAGLKVALDEILDEILGYFQSVLSELALLGRSRRNCFVSGHDFSRAVLVEQKSGL